MRPRKSRQHFSRFTRRERDRIPKLALETAEREGRFEAEGWRVRKDGTQFWANVVIDSIRDPEGRLVGFAKVTRDLTERRAAEEELRRSEERFRLLIQSVTDYAIYMLDPDGKSRAGTRERSCQGLCRRQIIGEHFRVYTEGRAAGIPSIALRPPSATAASGRRWRVRKEAGVLGERRHRSVEPDGTVSAMRRSPRLSERKQEQEGGANAEAFSVAEDGGDRQVTGGGAHDFNICCRWCSGA